MPETFSNELDDIITRRLGMYAESSACGSVIGRSTERLRQYGTLYADHRANLAYTDKQP